MAKRATASKAPEDHLREVLAPDTEKAQEPTKAPEPRTTTLTMEAQDIILTSINAHANNVRRSMDPVELAQLKDSLQRYGLLEPIVVEPIPGKRAGHRYQLIAGFRRYQAAKALGWESIPARVIDRTLSNRERVAVQLTENLQRESMRVRDIVTSVQTLRDDNLSMSEIASLLGLGVSTVRLYSQLGELLAQYPKLWPYFDRGMISIEQFRAASRLLTRIRERANERISDPGELELIRAEAETLFVQFLERLGHIQPLTVKRVSREVGQWLARVGVEDTKASPPPSNPSALFKPVLGSYLRLDVSALDAAALEELINASEAKIDSAKSRLAELASR